MLILPTRGRAAQLIRFIQAYKNTKALTRVFVYFDDDDPAGFQYHWSKQAIPSHWILKTGPRIKPGPVFNEVFALYPNEPFYGFLGDDVVPLCNYWDQVLIQRAGSDGVAWPDDLMCHEAIATHPVIGGDLVRSVGFLTYGNLKQYFIDTWWTYVAKKLGVARYCPDVVFDHRHHTNDKAPVDDTYRGKWPDAETDRKIYDDFVNDPATETYINGLQK
jgi:hypothetical protein